MTLSICPAIYDVHRRWFCLQPSTSNLMQRSMALKFELIKKDPFSEARLGKIETAHGSFTTPAFLPVGTQGTVKSLTPEELVEIGVEVILGNTYHLYLRQGTETIGRLGGVPAFI